MTLSDIVPTWRSSRLFLLCLASAGLLQACDTGDETGACVTTKPDGTSYCFDDKSYCSDTHHVGSSCAAAGYPYFCTTEDMKNSGSHMYYYLSRYLNNASCNPETKSGSGGGGDCVSSCPSEFSDVQLDSFCRAACCHAVTGNSEAARGTCQVGAELGTSRCRYCN
jgi:hypothetical protein